MPGEGLVGNASFVVKLKSLLDGLMGKGETMADITGGGGGGGGGGGQPAGAMAGKWVTGFWGTEAWWRLLIWDKLLG